MVEIADIEDQESLQVWLERTGQPTEACVALAQRAAMRGIPILADFCLQTPDHSILPVLRALLVSGVASGAPVALLAEAGKGHIQAAAGAAVTQIDSADFSAPDYTSATLASEYITHAAALAAIAYAYSDHPAAAAAEAADLAAIAAAIDTNHPWSASGSDCAILAEGGDLSRQPLWPEKQDDISQRWLDTSHSFSKKNGWQFWIDWYECALAGEPQPWPLLLEIALQEDAFWQGSDDEVMFRINEIVGEYEAAAHQDADDAVEITEPVSAPNRAELDSAKGNAPNAEEIFLNDGVFDVRPLTDIPPDPLAASRQAAMGLVSDMQTAAKGSNAYGELALVADDIETEIGRSEAWPMMIYDALTEAVAGIDYLVRAGELPEHDWQVERFKRRLSKAAHDIYLWDSYVRQAVDKRNEKHFDALTEDDRRNILTLIRALVSESSSLLADQLRRDAETIAGAASFAAASVKNAIYRVYSRLVAMAHVDWDRVDKLSKLAGIGGFVVAIIALFV